MDYTRIPQDVRDMLRVQDMLGDRGLSSSLVDEYIEQYTQNPDEDTLNAYNELLREYKDATTPDEIEDVNARLQQLYSEHPQTLEQRKRDIDAVERSNEINQRQEELRLDFLRAAQDKDFTLAKEKLKALVDFLEDSGIENERVESLWRYYESVEDPESYQKADEIIERYNDAPPSEKPEILLEMRALYESDTEVYEELEPYTRDAQENYEFLEEVWALLQDKGGY